MKDRPGIQATKQDRWARSYQNWKQDQWCDQRRRLGENVPHYSAGILGGAEYSVIRAGPSGTSLTIFIVGIRR